MKRGKWGKRWGQGLKGKEGGKNEGKITNKTKGPGEEGAARYCPKFLLPKRAKMVLCSFHRTHREICTRNRPLSETKSLDDFWGPFLSRPLCFTAEKRAGGGPKAHSKNSDFGTPMI